MAFTNGSQPFLDRWIAKLRRYYRSRKAVNDYARFQDFLTLYRQSRMREVYLAELFGRDLEKVSIPIGAINEESGEPNKGEFLYVCAIAQFIKAQKIFEFGTYLGRTTYHLAYAPVGVEVTTLDLPPSGGSATSPYLGSYYHGTGRESQIQQILCDAYKFDPTPFLKQMDFIFIDGDHSYKGVKNDTEKAFKMLAPGGVILWHDYDLRRDMGLVNYFVEFTQKVPLFHLRHSSLLLHWDGVDPLTFQVQAMRPSLSQQDMASKELANQPSFIEPIHRQKLSPATTQTKNKK